MQIQNSTTSMYSNSGQNFKSVYPVYHWHKPANTYIPTFEIKTVKRYQRILTGILNSKAAHNHEGKSNTFLQEVIKFLSDNDKDYQNLPYVRTYFNYKGGIKEAWNGNVSSIEPCAYLLTGRDAADFETLYGKPIGYAKSGEIYEGRMNIHQKAAVEEAKLQYIYGGDKFVQEKIKKKNGNPIELHVIMSGGANSHKAKLIKMDFFVSGEKNNPLITNGIMQ